VLPEQFVRVQQQRRATLVIVQCEQRQQPVVFLRVVRFQQCIAIIELIAIKQFFERRACARRMPWQPASVGADRWLCGWRH
jgi:hypothetical protein